MKCSKCNKDNKKDSIFCIYCGKALNEKGITTEIVTPSRINPLALSGFIVSMVSASSSIFGIIGVVGIVLSAIGLAQVKKSNDRGRGFAIAGLVVGILSVAIGMFRLLLSLLMLIFD